MNCPSLFSARFPSLRCQRVIPAVLLCLIGAPALAAESALAAPLRMLWLGSSSAYYHDLPGQLADWLERGGAFPKVLPSLAGKSGTGVQRYLEPGFRLEYGVRPNQTVLDKIREEKAAALLDLCAPSGCRVQPVLCVSETATRHTRRPRKRVRTQGKS